MRKLLLTIAIGLTQWATAATDATSCIVNPNFDTNTNGWSNTTGAQSKISTGEKGGGLIAADQGHWQLYKGSAMTGKASQTLTGLPAGTYTVATDIVTTGFSGAISLYAGESKTAVVSGQNKRYSATAVVTDGTLEIGIDIATTGGTTIDFDAFTLSVWPQSGYVFNGDMENGTMGWNNTTGATFNVGDAANDGIQTGKNLSYWSPSAKTGKIYQTLTDIPNGTYTLSAGVWAAEGSQLKLYAGDKNMDLETVEKQYTLTDIKVTNRTLEIGLDIASSGNIAFDNFSLTLQTADYTLGAEYGTLIFPFAYTLPEGLTAYSCESVDATTHVLNLTEVSAPQAGKPYIVSGTASTFSIPCTAYAMPATNLTEGLLTGVYADTQIDEGYVLQQQDGVLGFYRIKETKPTLTAYHCSLQYDDPEVKAFSFTSTATGIEHATASRPARIYDLAGRLRPTVGKGLNIKNGKTIIVK